MIYVGIDASLNGHSLGVLDSEGVPSWFHGFTTKVTAHQKHPHWLSFYKLPTKAQPIHHIAQVSVLSQWTIRTLQSLGEPDELVVGMEDYAFGAISRGASRLHELGGAIKQWLLARDIRFFLYEPTRVKKMWTGHGRATKEQMQVKVHDWCGVDLSDSISGDGLADALLLARTAFFHHQILEGKFGEEDMDQLLRDGFYRATKKKPPIAIQPFMKCSDYSLPLPTLGENAYGDHQP